MIFNKINKLSQYNRIFNMKIRSHRSAHLDYIVTLEAFCYNTVIHHAEYRATEVEETQANPRKVALSHCLHIAPNSCIVQTPHFVFTLFINISKIVVLEKFY